MPGLVHTTPRLTKASLPGDVFNGQQYTASTNTVSHSPECNDLPAASTPGSPPSLPTTARSHIAHVTSALDTHGIGATSPRNDTRDLNPPTSSEVFPHPIKSTPPAPGILANMSPLEDARIGTVTR